MIKLGKILEYCEEWRDNSELPDWTINVRFATPEEKNEFLTTSTVRTNFDVTNNSMEIVVDPEMTVETLRSFIEFGAIKALHGHLEKSQK